MHTPQPNCQPRPPRQRQPHLDKGAHCEEGAHNRGGMPDVLTIPWGVAVCGGYACGVGSPRTPHSLGGGEDGPGGRGDGGGLAVRALVRSGHAGRLRTRLVATFRDITGTVRTPPARDFYQVGSATENGRFLKGHCDNPS